MAADSVHELDAFRTEVRAFLRENLPAEMAARNLTAVHPSRADILGWTAILAKKGWSVPKWPVAYGGTGWSSRRLAVFEEELDLAGAPAANIQGISLVGPVIYSFGTDAQKQRFLPAIRRGEEYWSQGFSEPNSGSDLASLRTRATREGESWVIDGQKIWTSQSMDADMCFVLARTDANVKQQLGISFFLVPLRADGVTVRPIRSIDEGESLCEVFFDGVRVPLDSLVGAAGKGWDYAKFLLANERTATAEVPRNKRLLARLKKIAATERTDGRPLTADPLFRNRIAELEIELVSLEAGVARVIDGDANPLLPSVLKVQGCELMQALQKAQVEALGPYGVAYFPQGHDALAPVQRPPPAAAHARDVVAEFLFRRAATIYGGSNEVQKNIVSKVLLGSGAPGNGVAREETEAMLASSATRWLERTYGFESRMAMRGEGAAALKRNWKTFADMGWLGVGAPEECGGLGGGVRVAAILAEAFGGALALEPFVESAFATARLVAGVATGARRSEILDRLLAGKTQFALAHEEAANGASAHLLTTARPTRDGFALDGRKIMVFGGQTADWFIVTARVEGAGAGLFLVPRAAPGLVIQPYRLIDGRLVADLVLDDAAIETSGCLNPEGDATAAMEDARGATVLVSCADAIGAMDAVLRLTRDYLLVRKQFGTALAGFQALQHRLAEMYARLEQARSITCLSLASYDRATREERRRLVHATKATVAKCAFFVGAQAIQLHGGIGMTEEYAVGHYFKRLLVFEALQGNAAHHTSEFARAIDIAPVPRE